MGESSKIRSRTWRPEVPLPPPSGKSSRRLLVVLVVVALSAVLGALIAWLFFISPFPQPSFLPLCIGEYGEEFPIRGWVEQDSDALRSLGWKEINAFTSQQREPLLAELRKAAERSDRPLVVYLSAYARANSEGELCILPIDAHLDRPEKWLRLSEVFRLLRESKARHKLLLLDIMQPFTDARRGLLVNDAAQRLQPVLDQAVTNDPRLSVLCACAPGQESLVAEELGHSVFAYFLWEGLRGRAEGENADRRGDGRVSMQELAAYVTAQVEGWTLKHRLVRQSPRFHGSKDDYPLVSVDSGAAQPAERADYPEWLRTGWKMRDWWLGEECHRLAPQTFRELEAVLLRAEQRWRGGLSPERVSAELAMRREELQSWRSQQLPAGRRRAAQSWDALLKAHPASGADLDVLRQAQQCCADACVQLAGYAPYLEVDADTEPVWENAVATACELRRLLASPPGTAHEIWIRKIAALTAALRNDPNNLQRLRRPLDRPEYDRLIGQRHRGDDADLKVMTALLATPWPRAEERSQLWSARRDLLAAMQGRRAGSNAGTWDEGRAIAAQYQRGLQRARRSLKLLQLEGADHLERVVNALAQASQKPTDEARLRVLGEELKQAWLRRDESAARLEGRH